MSSRSSNISCCIRSAQNLVNHPTNLTKITCGVCSAISWDPVQCPSCRQIFCRKCVYRTCTCGLLFLPEKCPASLSLFKSLIFQCHLCGLLVPYLKTQEHQKNCWERHKKPTKRAVSSKEFESCMRGCSRNLSSYQSVTSECIVTAKGLLEDPTEELVSEEFLRKIQTRSMTPNEGCRWRLCTYHRHLLYHGIKGGEECRCSGDSCMFTPVKQSSDNGLNSVSCGCNPINTGEGLKKSKSNKAVTIFPESTDKRSKTPAEPTQNTTKNAFHTCNISDNKGSQDFPQLGKVDYSFCKPQYYGKHEISNKLEPTGFAKYDDNNSHKGNLVETNEEAKENIEKPKNEEEEEIVAELMNTNNNNPGSKSVKKTTKEMESPQPIKKTTYKSNTNDDAEMQSKAPVVMEQCLKFDKDASPVVGPLYTAVQGNGPIDKPEKFPVSTNGNQTIKCEEPENELYTADNKEENENKDLLDELYENMFNDEAGANKASNLALSPIEENAKDDEKVSYKFRKYKKCTADNGSKRSIKVSTDPLLTSEKSSKGSKKHNKKPDPDNPQKEYNKSNHAEYTNMAPLDTEPVNEVKYYQDVDAEEPLASSNYQSAVREHSPQDYTKEPASYKSSSQSYPSESAKSRNSFLCRKAKTIPANLLAPYVTKCKTCPNIILSTCCRICCSCRGGLCNKCDFQCYFCARVYCRGCCSLSQCLICGLDICKACTKPCTHCGKATCKNCAEICERCERRFCNNSACISSCVHCKGTYCADCVAHCVTCKGDICDKMCLRRCTGCYSIYCPSCAHSCNKCNWKFEVPPELTSDVILANAGKRVYIKDPKWEQKIAIKGDMKFVKGVHEFAIWVENIQKDCAGCGFGICAEEDYKGIMTEEFMKCVLGITANCCGGSSAIKGVKKPIKEEAAYSVKVDMEKRELQIKGPDMEVSAILMPNTAYIPIVTRCHGKLDITVKPLTCFK